MPRTTSKQNHEPQDANLESFKLLDMIKPGQFDQIAEIVGVVLGMDPSHVVLLGRNQHWFRFGHPNEKGDPPSDILLCRNLASSECLFITDPSENPVLRNKAPGLSLFVSLPLVSKSGVLFANLCIFDEKHRELSPERKKALTAIVSQLAGDLEERRELLELRRGTSNALSAERSLSVFKQALDSSVNAITIADLTQPDEPIIYINSAFEKLTGYTSFEVVGRNCRFLQGKDRNQRVREEIREAIEKRTQFKGVIRNYRKDGSPFWNELSLFPIKDENGHVAYMLGEQTNRNIDREVSNLPYPATDERTTHLEGLLGKSQPMKALFTQIEAVAKFDASVLIEGETGTGKELIARAIHKLSSRAKHPFIAINCAGISETLLMSQLFGHKRGSFTGAIDNSQGVFEAANNGTIFFDEVGDMPASLQMALLRVLQEKEVTRIGETSPRKINVRILAATHRDMTKLVSEKTFREDLYYRFKVVRIHAPSLRSHPEDITELAESFLAEFSRNSPKKVEAISPQALAVMQRHTWPGNVRELRSSMEYAFIQCRGQTIDVLDLPPEVSAVTTKAAHPAPVLLNEEDRISEALNQAGGNRNKAAQLLGLSRATLFRKLAAYRKSKAAP